MKAAASGASISVSRLRQKLQTSRSPETRCEEAAGEPNQCSSDRDRERLRDRDQCGVSPAVEEPINVRAARIDPPFRRKSIRTMLLSERRMSSTAAWCSAWAKDANFSSPSSARLCSKSRACSQNLRRSSWSTLVHQHIRTSGVGLPAAIRIAEVAFLLGSLHCYLMALHATLDRPAHHRLRPEDGTGESPRHVTALARSSR